MTRALPALLLALFTLLAALPPQQALAQDDQPSGAIDVENSATRDAAIATRIRSILDELDGYEDVTVTVSSGIVTLRGTTLDGATAERLNALVARVEGVVAIENEVTETTDVVRRLNPAWDRFETRMWQLAAKLPLMLVAAAVFSVIVFLGWLAARAKQPWDRLAPNAFIAGIYRQLVWLAFIIGGVVIALDIMGATALLGTILGAAGIIGLAIGFAVRDTVENFIASVMLSIRQPFAPNDLIEINGDEGKVIRLTSRATILLSHDGNHIRIPNATVFKSRIVNFSRNAERRFVFEVGVDAGEEALAQVRTLAEETVAALAFTLTEPAPNVWIDRIGDGAMILKVTGWIDQRETSLVRAKGEAIRQVMAAISAAGFEMPNTTYRIELPEGATGALAGFTVTTAEEESAAAPATVRPAASPAPDHATPGAVTLAEESVETREGELDRIVDSERRDPEAPDLLKEEAPKE